MDIFEPQQGTLAPLKLVRYFDEAECVRIRQIGESIADRPGTMSLPIENYRRCDVAIIREDNECRWLFERLADAAAIANQVFQLDIERYPVPLNYTKYEKGGLIEWHTDYDYHLPDPRKVSLTVQLTRKTEYEGGGLEFFPWGEVEMSRGLGTVIAFPSILTHCVRPLAAGSRRSLVAWFRGPRLK
jgi:PKHD-type hydroxylase